MSEFSRAARPYPTFSGERVYLTSSQDLVHVRFAVRDMLDGLLSRLVTERRIETFEWLSGTAETPFDQRLNRQANLPRPSDENCAGLIALFGERIGMPLRDLDRATLQSFEPWTDAALPFRLVLDWPDDRREQLALVDQGCYPMTGTVFEVLDAISSGKPHYVAYFADRALGDNSRDVRLNGWNWRNQMLRTLPTQDVADWVSFEYPIQSFGLTNFLKALIRGRQVPRFQDSQDALRGIRSFVETRIAVLRANEENPYRFLDFYDILDGELPGRSDDGRKVADELRRRADPAAGEPMIARIAGESGCGKTSFMRAGVLAVLNRPSEQGRFRVLAVRPTDFHDETGRPDRSVLEVLLKLVASHFTDLTLSPVALDKITRAGDRGPRMAVKLLEEALSANNGQASRIVIGLDQFEEIIDDLAAGDRLRSYGRRWLPLLSFVDLAVTTGRFGFVYTLETSRADTFARLDLPPAFRAAFEFPLGGQDDAFIESIITVPFRKAGYRLAPAIVKQLLRSYKEFSAKNQGHASLLPVLALKLSNLFETVQGFRLQRSVRNAEGRLQAHFDEDVREISYEMLKDELRFENEIEDLAARARGTSSKTEAQEIDDLNFLLQPLVALSGDDFGRITLHSIVEPTYVGLRDRLKAFESVRLVIRENGRLRLVHEAVVRQWELAAKWLKHHRSYLVKEAVLRTAANAWADEGADLGSLPADEATLDIAARVLWNYLHDWPAGNPADLPPEDRNLRQYCTEIFRRGSQPRRPVRMGTRQKVHLHLAAAYGLDDVVTRMVTDDPACVPLLDTSGRTAIDAAAWQSSTTVMILIAHGASAVRFDPEGWSPLAAAIWQKKREIFAALQPYYRTAEQIRAPSGATLLHIAAHSGAVEMAATILATVIEARADAEDDDGWTPLDYAARADRPEALEFFLQHCDVRHRSSRTADTVLHRAAAAGARRAVDVILSLPEFHDLVNAPNKDGRTALMLAATNRHDAVVRRLLEVANPNAQDNVTADTRGWTALHFAVAGASGTRESRVMRQQALRTVQALLDAEDIDPRLTDEGGREPISLASALPRVQNELLAHRGFAWNHRLPDGSTPLNHLIAANDRTAVERMLVRRDLDVDLLSLNGDYALHLLIVNDMVDIARQLIESGRAQPWLVEGASAIGLVAAISGGHKTLAKAYCDTMTVAAGPHQRQYLTRAAGATIIMDRGAMLSTLLDLGADPLMALGALDYTLLHLAASVGDTASFEMLAGRAGTSTVRDKWGRLPVDLTPQRLSGEIAARMRGDSCAPRASEARVSSAHLGRLGWTEPLPDGTLPLHWMIRKKNRRGLERMLGSELDADGVSRNGDYVLQLLLNFDMAPLATHLVESGRVRPWLVDNASDIGLASAVRSGRLSLATAILDTLTDKPARRPAQRRYLALAGWSAIVGRNRAMFERIVEAGADPVLPMSLGWTLLHVAAMVGDVEGFERLKTVAPTPPPLDNWGRSPADLSPTRVRDRFISEPSRLRL